MLSPVEDSVHARRYRLIIRLPTGSAIVHVSLVGGRETLISPLRRQAARAPALPRRRMHNALRSRWTDIITVAASCFINESPVNRERQSSIGKICWPMPFGRSAYICIRLRLYSYFRIFVVGFRLWPVLFIGRFKIPREPMEHPSGELIIHKHKCTTCCHRLRITCTHTRC